MSPATRGRIGLAVGVLCMLALALAATWALTNWTIGPRTYNGVVLPPPQQEIGRRGFFAPPLSSAWMTQDNKAVLATLGQWNTANSGGAEIVVVPSDWATTHVDAGEQVEMVVNASNVKNVTAFVSPVKEPTPRDVPLPVTSVTQQGDLTIVAIDSVPQLADQMIMLVVEFDTKRLQDYAEYRWRVIRRCKTCYD